MQKPVFRSLRNNIGENQPAHLRSPIKAIVICFLESIICKPATCEISIFKLVSVSMETGLKLTLLETPKTVFRDEAHL